MLISAQIDQILERVGYKKGWSVVHRELPGHAGGYLQVHYDGGGDAAYGAVPWTGRKYMLSEHMTETEIVYSAFKAIMAAEEHEIRELFTYEGAAVCGPHYSVRRLVDLVHSGTLGVDVREDAMEGA